MLDSRTRIPNYGVVVCTRNRPAELERCLRWLSRQTVMPEQVVIVDSSDDGVAVSAKRAQITFGAAGVPVKYLRSSPGLTAQRNLGISQISGSGEIDLILFVDDDVLLGPDYVEILARCFESGVVGATGADVRLPRTRRIDRFLYPRVSSNSQLSRTGHNWFPAERDHRLVVDWLCGCAPIYHASVFSALSFDESRTNACHGEDVEFSMRARAAGDLVWEPRATFIHNPSVIGRSVGSAAARELVAHRRSLVRASNAFKSGWVSYGLALDGVRSLARAVRDRDVNQLAYGATLLVASAAR